MCNEIARRLSLDLPRDDFADLRIPLRFPEGLPNLPATDSVRITDPTLIVRAATGAAEADAVVRRWSWAGGHGRPVYNVRAEGQALRDGALAGRCLVPADGFYEFTAPEPGRKRKTRWLFTHAAERWFAIAGVWRTVPADPSRDPPDAATAERFALLTCEPGPDVAPYHSRQIVILAREHWERWLDPAADVRDLVAPLPAGALAVERAG